jgi:hypothetical protein
MKLGLRLHRIMRNVGYLNTVSVHGGNMMDLETNATYHLLLQMTPDSLTPYFFLESSCTYKRSGCELLHQLNCRKS